MNIIRPNKKKLLCCPHRPKNGRTGRADLFFFFLVSLLSGLTVSMNFMILRYRPNLMQHEDISGDFLANVSLSGEF